MHRRGLLATAHGEGERPAALVPVGALEDPALALDPAPVRVLDVLAARREDVEDDPPTFDEQLAGGAERAEAVGLGRHVQQRAKGDQHQWHALRDRRVAHVAETEIEQLLDAFGTRVLQRDLEHPGRGVDADQTDARPSRSGSRSGPCRRRARRPARRTRGLRHVELHVSVTLALHGS
jgi:hypothetical protein